MSIKQQVSNSEYDKDHQLTLLAPYTPPKEDGEAEFDDYLLHKAKRRFSLSGKDSSLLLFAGEQVARLAKVNLKAASHINETLEKGFDKVGEGQQRIHGALVHQTQIVEKGFDKVVLALDAQLAQEASDAAISQKQNEQLILKAETQNQLLEHGFKGLASRIDMGMSGIVAQFELQRQEIQSGLEKLSELLANKHKTSASERFQDGQEAYGQYLRHPDEPRFLTDAEAYLVNSVESYRGNPFAHLYLGHIYHEAGPVFDLQKAQEHYLACSSYAKGIDNQALAAQGYFMAAWIAYVRRLPARAVELGKLAIEYDPQGLPEAYFNLGKYYANMGKAEDAIAQLDIAVRTFDPLYSLKASLDADYIALGTALDQYFEKLKTDEQAYWDARLLQYI